jgi:hypothetical protein
MRSPVLRIVAPIYRGLALLECLPDTLEGDGQPVHECGGPVPALSFDAYDAKARLAVGRHGDGLLSGPQPEESPSDGRLIGNEPLGRFRLDRADDGVALFLAFDVDHDCRADANLVASVLCVVDDHGLTEQGIQISNPLLNHCLIVFCRVIPGILSQIAV